MTSDLGTSPGRESLRPFYLVLVVWGEKYRNYFLEYCLPSLLAPGNIPGVAKLRPLKYLIVTTVEDWAAMRDTPIFRELERYVNPTFIQLPTNDDSAYWMQNIVGHKLCCDIVAKDNAYRLFTSPDAIFSDGMFLRLHEAALDGAQAVLKLVAPLTREDIFVQTLSKMGLLPAKSARDTGIPLVFSPRQIAAIALRAIHGLSRVQEWEAPYFAGFAATPWWKIPGREAIVIFSNRWDLMLIDYAAVRHDGSILDERGFDGDYIMRMIGNLQTIYIVRDSDEFHGVSWATLPEPPPRRQFLGQFGKGPEFRTSAQGCEFNAMQRDLLFMPTYVYAGEMGVECKEVESKALATIATWADPPNDIERYSRQLKASRRNFTGLQAQIDACRYPWWRRNAMVWGVYSRTIIPFLIATLAPRLRRIRMQFGVLLRALSGAEQETAAVKHKIAALTSRFRRLNG